MWSDAHPANQHSIAQSRKKKKTHTVPLHTLRISPKMCLTCLIIMQSFFFFWGGGGYRINKLSHTLAAWSTFSVLHTQRIIPVGFLSYYPQMNKIEKSDHNRTATQILHKQDSPEHLITVCTSHSLWLGFFCFHNSAAINPWTPS